MDLTLTKLGGPFLNHGLAYGNGFNAWVTAKVTAPVYDAGGRSRSGRGNGMATTRIVSSHNILPF